MGFRRRTGMVYLPSFMNTISDLVITLDIESEKDIENKIKKIHATRKNLLRH